MSTRRVNPAGWKWGKNAMMESRKKMVIFGGGLAGFIIFLTGVYFYFNSVNYNISGGANSGKTSLNDRELSVVPLNPVNPTPQVAPNEPKLPEYRGSSIGTVNEDKSVSGQYPEETKQALLKELSGLSESLAKNPDTLDGWLRAGVVKKFFGDYAGARDLWEYAGLIRPKNSVSFFNLGGLYGLYLKDYPKAEKNYKIAIISSPADIFQYIALADLYKFSWIEKTTE